jgi:hypothetical protein
MRRWSRVRKIRDLVGAESPQTHVGMESTGVYGCRFIVWRKDIVDLIVGNARRIRNVPRAQDGGEGCRVVSG